MTTETAQKPPRVPKPRPGQDYDDPADSPEDVEQRAAEAHQAQMGAAPMDDDLDLSIVEDRDVEIGMPLIPRARVVYVGSHPKKNEPIRGQMVTESWESEPAVEADPARGIKARPAVMEYSKTPTTESGITSYNFAIRDERGRILTQRLMPRDANQKVAGKPWGVCEHPEHLRYFLRKRDRAGVREYEVLIPMAKRAAFDNYVSDKERAIGRHHALADYSAGLRQTPE